MDLDLSAHILNLTPEFEIALAEKRIRYRAELSDFAVWARADPEAVTQILLNLVENARKFSPAESEITVSLEAGENAVQVHVADQGPGISPEMQDVIFERFQRVEPTTQARTSGVGLGLPIVRELLRLQQGEVVVQSAVGEGSTFTFTLPRPRAADRVPDKETQDTDGQEEKDPHH